jgi:hypothetical protein
MAGGSSAQVRWRRTTLAHELAYSNNERESLHETDQAPPQPRRIPRQEQPHAAQPAQGRVRRQPDHGSRPLAGRGYGCQDAHSALRRGDPGGSYTDWGSDLQEAQRLRVFAARVARSSCAALSSSKFMKVSRKPFRELQDRNRRSLRPRAFFRRDAQSVPPVPRTKCSAYFRQFRFQWKSLLWNQAPRPHL